MKTTDIKNGTLKKAVRAIRKQQQTASIQEKIQLTKLLLSISDLLYIIQQLESGLTENHGLFYENQNDARPNSPSFAEKEEDLFNARVSVANSIQEETFLNVFIEFDLNGIIQYISPTCLQVFGSVRKN